MADRIAGIYVDLGLNSAAFSKGLTDAQGRVQKFSSVTKSSLGQLAKGVFGGLAAGALSTIAPILGLAAAVNTTKEALQQFGDISDSAKASGLDSEFFQGLAYQAGLGGVSIEQLSASLSGFNRASGQAEAGTGRMSAALAKLNPELLKSLNAAKSQEERVRLAADAISKAGSASEKAALSVALFGDSGTKLVDVFNGGATAIDAAANKARSLGLIIDRELIAKADQMGDEFDTATQVLDLQFKAALVGLAPILTGTAGLIGGVVMAVRGLVEQFSALDARSTDTLEGRLAVIKQLQATIGSDVTLPNGQIVPENPMAVSIGGADQGKLEEERKQIEAILALRKALEVPPPAADAGGGYNAVAQDAVDKAQAVLDALKFEEAQLGRTAVQQEIYNNLKAAGVTAESAFGQQIVDATTRLEGQRDAIEANKAAMEQFGDIAQSATRSFIDDLIEGKSAAEAFGNVLADIGNRLIGLGLDSLFGTGGGSAGLVGQLFGIPGRAAGGPVTAGQPYIVGEKRPELFVPSTSGRIIPSVPKMPTAMSAGGITVNFNPVIDARGADPAAITRLSGELAKMKAELPSTVVGAVRRARSTGNL